MTPTASQALGHFVADLDYVAIPEPARAAARQCIADTVAVATYGARFPWSHAIATYAAQQGIGPCRAFGRPELRLTAAMAALVNGAAAHAFEMDSLRFPGAGVHPGATLLPPAYALAQELHRDGEALLTAFVAGCEVMFRIGRASHHSSETLGFHAPGLTGAFGAAVVAAKLLQLDASQVTHALGIAGSMCAGVLAFTKADTGAMVKRLHMGRAAEAGVVAARLAQGGFTGPETILDGRFGFLDVYCKEKDAAELTAALGERWETGTICLKRFACHITAHTPVQALNELMAREHFGGADIAAITIEGSAKLASHHGNPVPSDIMQGQYSVPFCVALAAYRDANDPSAFNDAAVHDAGIRSLAARVALVPATRPLPSSWATRLHVQLHGGRAFDADALSFKGMPADPLTDAQMQAKFMRLVGNGNAHTAWECWRAVDLTVSVASEP